MQDRKLLYLRSVNNALYELVLIGHTICNPKRSRENESPDPSHVAHLRCSEIRWVYLEAQVARLSITSLKRASDLVRLARVSPNFKIGRGGEISRFTLRG